MSALHLPIKESAYFAGVGLGSANNIFDKDANLKLLYQILYNSFFANNSAASMLILALH